MKGGAEGEVSDPTDVVDQLMVVGAFEQRVVVGAVGGEQRDDARDEQIKGRHTSTSVDRKADHSSKKEDVANGVGDRDAFGEPVEP